MAERRSLLISASLLALLLMFAPKASADFGPQITPYTSRGTAALAIMSSFAALGVVVSAVQRRRRRNSAILYAGSVAPAVVTPVPQVATGSRIRPIALGIAQVLAGILFIVLLSYVARRTILAPDLPPGWQIIRPPNEATTLAEQGQFIWAGGRSGLWSIDRFSGTVDKSPGNAPKFRRVRDLLLDDQDRLWIAHQDGLTRYDGASWVTLDESEFPFSGPTYALYLDQDGRLWVGADQGVAVYNDREWQTYGTNAGLAVPAVTFIFQDQEGLMWFGSDSADNGGLSSFDGQKWSTYSQADGLAHNSINMIIQDREDALWFATGFGSQGGANRLLNGRWETWTAEDGLAGGKVRSIYEDKNGRLWFGSEYDGMAVYDGAGFELLTPQKGLAGWEVKHMIQDLDGVYWLGTENGLSRISRYDGYPVDGG